MKRIVPLYAQILVWLIANMLFVCWAAFFFFPERYGLGWNALLTDATRERLQNLATQLVVDMGPVIERELKLDLQRYDRAHRVRFGIFAADGRQLAGEEHLLPKEILRELARTDILVVAAIPGPLLGNLGELMGDKGSRIALPEWPPFDVRELQRQQFLLHVDQRYWIGIRAALSDRDGRRVPVTVLLDTESFLRLAMFLDISPWLAAALLLVLISIAFWLPLLWSISRAMAVLLRITERIADGQFDARTGISRQDEIGRLAQAVDTVGGRLENFVASQKNFLADIAHEVSSPLGRLQLSLGLLENVIDERARAAFDDVHEETQLMSELLGELLAFSRASVVGDGRQPPLPFSLQGFVFAVLARENARERVHVNVPDAIQVRVNTALLGRAIGNLVRNAIRYAGTDRGPIEITAQRLERMISLRIMDRGPGVPELALLKLGDPFYRPESARSRSSGGIGLGLATVRNCVTACGGNVGFRNRPGGGFEAEIRLPLPDF
jgi:two-component system sensor histidine kinase CpxA